MTRQVRIALSLALCLIPAARAQETPAQPGAGASGASGASGAWDLTPPTREPRSRNEPRYALLGKDKNSSSMAERYRPATLLYLPRSIARTVPAAVAVLVVIVVIVQAPRGEGNGIVW